MPDLAIAALLALTTFCTYLLWHIGQAVARIEADISALRAAVGTQALSRLSDPARMTPEK